MRFFKTKMIGIEVTGSEVKVAHIDRMGAALRLVRGARAALPQGTVKLSFKNPNILDSERFRKSAERALEALGTEVDAAGLSLPSEMVKILIQRYPDLPDSAAETERLIGWGIERSFQFPVPDAKIGYQRLGSDPDGQKRLLLAIGMSAVIAQYEAAFKELGIETRVLRPAGLNLFNVFSDHIPGAGIVAFMGLFDSYFNFMVFEDGALTFFHGVKRGFSDLQFFQDVDMTIKHYMDSNPGKKVQQLRVGSQVGYHHELREVLNNLIDMDITILNEGGIILSDYDMSKPMERLELSSYVSAIGAALSLES